MLILWPIVLGLGYYLAPSLGILRWLKRLWGLRSGWLRGLSLAVLILTLVMSLNAQAIPSYNLSWMLVLGFAVFLPHFLPNTPEARPYHLATHALLLFMSLALHLWYCYLYQRPVFDGSFAYFALPCLSACLALALLLIPRQKKRWMQLATIILAAGIGLALGQFFYLYAYI
jgi:hypothetical protein